MHGLYFLYSFLQVFSYQQQGYIFLVSILFIMINSNITGNTCLRIASLRWRHLPRQSSVLVNDKLEIGELLKGNGIK